MGSQLDAILFEFERLVPFERGWHAQRQLQQRLLLQPEGPDAVILLQHEPCYTLGRGADPGFLRFDAANPPLPLHRIDRGGEVTHHCPGQLVLYPVLNLQRHGADLHLYLRQLEQVVIDLLAEYGLAAERLADLTGVWLEGHKLAGFSQVVPCGLVDRPVGRLLDWRPQLSAAAVAPRLLEVFADRFGLVLRAPEPQEQLQGW